MSGKTLLDLPVEVLQLMCGYLDSRGLSAFSRSSRHCRAAANSCLFSTIDLCFEGLEKLESDLDRWAQLLDSNAAWAAVQVLDIHPELDTPPLAPISDLGDDPLEPWKYYAYMSPPQRTQEYDHDFKKMAAFLARLTALKDMVWACHHQLPPCILSALEAGDRNHLPRLHLRTFRMRSLLVRPPSSIEVSSYEARLARSQVLHSVALRHSSYDDEGYADFNLEAVKAITASLSPNLKEVYLCEERPGSSLALLQALKHPRQKRQDSELGAKERTKPGCLTTLVLAQSNTLDEIRGWTQLTDFTKLRVLKLYRAQAELLRWLTETRPFSGHLYNLALHCSESAGDAIGGFFESLPPLRTLSLSGVDKLRALKEVFRQYGSSLETLFFDETLVDSDILDIVNTCPNLRTISLAITRSAGDKQETACYRALGAIRRLSHVTLRLLISKRSTAFDEAAVTRAALIDSAVDESLAAAIYRTISVSSTSPGGSLQSLRISVDPDEDAFERNILKPCSMIARSWDCEKSPRDDAPAHSCVVKEVGVEEREDNEAAFGRTLTTGVETVVRDLWPEQATGDWRHDWHSWPLQYDEL